MAEVAPLRRSACDQSGLCDEVVAIGLGRENRRLVARVGTASVLVDLAPVSLGHLLVVSDEHVPRTTLLASDALADIREGVEVARRRLTQQFGVPVAQVEHGSGNVRSAGDCVRHCHIHVVPVRHDQRAMDLRPLLEAVLQDLQAIPSPYIPTDDPTGYVCVELAQECYLGFPREGVRHVARVIVSLLTGADPDYADWGLMIRNPHFEATIGLLGERSLSRAI